LIEGQYKDISLGFSEDDLRLTILSEYNYGCNVPRPSSVFGKEIRDLFRVARGRWMLGVDLSGIEARIWAHGAYQFPGGPEFAELITVGDFHSSNAGLWNCSRENAKAELYA
jgi:hypothetical protein